MAEQYQIDMCRGPLLPKIVRFALPLICTYALQLLFNAMDLVVIGNFASHESLAAIGATANLNSMMITAFMGIAIGANVLAARYFGAGKEENFRRTVQTAMAMAVFGGALLAAVALLTARPLLVLMGTPAGILPKSCLYVWICFAAIPFVMIYNFGCAVLRAVGDTRRPMVILVIAGIVNVLLNLLLVIRFRMDVAGVAVATAVSHGLSAAAILFLLVRSRDACHLTLRHLRVDRATVLEMLRIGIPAGVENSCFAVSNMLIQASINGFGSHAIAGSTAGMVFESIVYVGSLAFHHSTIAFVSQNFGGGAYRRIVRSVGWCLCCSVVICSVTGYTFLFFADPLLGLINADPQVIAWGRIRMEVLFSAYFLCGIMDVFSGALRGLGHSTLTAGISLFGACGFRVFWIEAVFSCPRFHTFSWLLTSFPISWTIVSLVGAASLTICLRRITREAGLPDHVLWSYYTPGPLRGLRFLLRSK